MLIYQFLIEWYNKRYFARAGDNSWGLNELKVEYKIYVIFHCKYNIYERLAVLIKRSVTKKIKRRNEEILEVTGIWWAEGYKEFMWINVISESEWLFYNWGIIMIIIIAWLCPVEYQTFVESVQEKFEGCWFKSHGGYEKIFSLRCNQSK